MTNVSPAVRLTGIRKDFSGQLVLENINLDLPMGKVTGLLGGNASGKSTILKLLTGELTPSAGLIEVNGTVHRKLSYRTSQALGIMAVYQDLALCPQLSVVENIFLGREWGHASVAARCLGLLDRKGMSAEAERRLRLIGVTLTSLGSPILNLSGGQKQATAFSRVFDPKWRVFLLDEPTSAFADNVKKNICGIVRQFAHEDCAVLYISHDRAELQMVADRLVVLQRGVIVDESTVDARC